MSTDPKKQHARRRIVVVGTPQTIHAASAALPGESSDAPLGAVLADPASSLLDGGRMSLLGSLEDLRRLHDELQFDTAVVSLPRSMEGALRETQSCLEDLGVAIRHWPALDDVLGEDAPDEARPGGGRHGAWSSAMSDESVLLVGRKPRPVNEPLVRSVVSNRRLLITGAGGSIGSELSRIAARFSPAELVLMDRSENALFEIDRQIAARFPGVTRRAVFHDVTDDESTLRRLVDLRPDVVFHAAAHKHVPMMEDHPAQAVNNNVFGTKSVADAALAVGAERFVLISTDKAVHPSSVMGATKRMAEQYVQSLNERGATRFSLVRFGNVLGSACSVLPIWGRQIDEGGPVTVTDPRMTRFFMTIPEAATLVIQAAALDRDQTLGADVLVLDMGDPVRIIDLAERFIRAHGLEPQILEAGEDPDACQAGTMPIAITGARPGEKLHEQLAHEDEELRPTPSSGVLAWMGPQIDPRDVTAMIAELSSVRRAAEPDRVHRLLRRWAPELTPRGDDPPDQGALTDAA